MKRALLIAGGTVGGLGVVLSMTPPQLGVANGGISTLAAATSTSVDPQSASPRNSTPASPPARASTKKAVAPVATTSPATGALKTSVKRTVKRTTPPPVAKPSAPPTSTPVTSGVSGSFTGATFDASQSGQLWGRVSVTVTLTNGELTNVSAVQNPSSRSSGAFSYLTPVVLSQKLTAKTVMSISPSSLVSQIRGYTGASYSSYAYWESLQSALSKAGL